MFNSYYKLEISGKDVKRFIRMLYKMSIYFIEINFVDNVCFVKVDLENYKKILNVRTSYNINVVNIYGIRKILYWLKNNSIFLFFLFLGILLVYFLSNVIFLVEVIHDDSSIRTLLIDELDKYGIKKYSFIRDYDYIQKVKNNILNNNKDKIEWIEIERVGTSYNVRVEKRIINEIKKEDSTKHIVAKKPGIIMKIQAENGEVVKKINDYVKEGDIIISGSIYKNNEVINNVSASGLVFAEVWYKVKITMPINYKEESLTGNKKNVINFKFLNKDINLFDFKKYKNKKTVEKKLFSDFFGMFKINYNQEIELDIKDEVNNIVSEEFAYKLAREKIESNLDKNEYIISQKKLKTVMNDSTIITEMFFKVYENISSPKYYSILESRADEGL